MLYPDTSGTPLDRLPVLLPQEGPAALSPDGQTLYEIVQTNLTDRSWASTKGAVFDLTAVNANNGVTIAVLHTWHRTWQNFYPLMSLDPTGNSLLIVDHATLDRVTIAGARFAKLAGRLHDPLNTSWQRDGTSVIGPLAW